MSEPSSDELLRVFEDGRLDCWNTPGHGGLAECCDRVGIEAVRSLIEADIAEQRRTEYRLVGETGEVAGDDIWDLDQARQLVRSWEFAGVIEQRDVRVYRGPWVPVSGEEQNDG